VPNSNMQLIQYTCLLFTLPGRTDISEGTSILW
jgi:hypothetical protein